MLQIIVFSATLFPVPVAPAINRCGIVTRSEIIGLPTISLPNPNVSGDFACPKICEAATSLKTTTSRLAFGTSIPITALPGIGAIIRILIARSASARSSDKLTTLLILMPGAGSNSKRVITGPGSTVTTFPFTPKSSNFCSSNFDKYLKFS